MGRIKKSEIIRNLHSLLPEEKVEEIRSRIKPWVTEKDVIVLGAGPSCMVGGIYFARVRI